MKKIPCPVRGCGRSLRPCNMARHIRASHTPKLAESEHGTAVIAPPAPPRASRGKDRRYDDVLPRGVGPHRYRIYRLRAGDLQVIHTCSSAEEFGEALADLHGKGEFVGDDSVGVLDTATDPGHWIVNPFTLGRRPADV